MKIISVPEAFLKSAGVKNPKPIIYGTFAVLAGLTIFFVARAVIRNRKGKWNSGLTQERLQEDLQNLNTSGTTISKGDAITISQNLLNAMDRFGTDEEAILDNLGRCKTKGDLNLVIQTFGIKPKSSTGLADTFIERTIEGVMKNLNGWLRDELSGYYLREVKKIYEDLNVPF